MQTILSYELAFNFCWVLINSIIYYAEIDFLIRFTGSQHTRHVQLYVIINVFLTILAICTNMFNIFSLIQIIILFLFAIVFLKIHIKYVIAPAVIIFMLSTCMEGFTTIFMRFISMNLNNYTLGLVFQFILTVCLAWVLFLALRLIAKRYSMTNQNVVSSYFYILLLPCVLTIWGIRVVLGLNNTDKYGEFINGKFTTLIYACLCIVVILIIFFIILELFYKVTILSQKEIDKVLLTSQVNKQLCYIDEARKRNQLYRSFQHDINNHLLVLSGLLNTNKYEQAKMYLQKLDFAASSLANEVSTGNSVLDVLLWEKIRYAKQYEISVTCDVQIPRESTIDDVDICILFSNGIDNAIHACVNVEAEHKKIALTVKQKHDFLLISIVNAINNSKPCVYGTGLKNIRFIAEKYEGTMSTEQTENSFCLSVLLCINCNSKKR